MKKHNDLIYDIGSHLGYDTEFYLKKASENMNDHVILYHLGEVCKALQKKEDACKWWKKSIELRKVENPSQERVDHECSSK